MMIFLTGMEKAKIGQVLSWDWESVWNWISHLIVCKIKTGKWEGPSVLKKYQCAPNGGGRLCWGLKWDSFYDAWEVVLKSFLIFWFFPGETIFPLPKLTNFSATKWQ